MSEFYCPFCSSRYQFHSAGSHLGLVCGQCGEPLVRKKYFNFRQFFGLIVVSAFLAPLLGMILFIINDFVRKSPHNSETTKFSLLDKL